ncbi:MAG: pantetheine-phosphate adenylyltransferase [bacterium]|uniref:Phosphopantetheine adenylyltransferase n=2 Tax=Bacteria candidate phyla TaxID=1783234 RepID=A0A101I1W8_UNCT6|nr:MAG: Phosphopantetheine adenylyltransferase [candidate division TA06 bacterium 32_111]KUK87125.1 MAG: Phosphopantetheine adenylyltransferase [candidate division TA06 bacterium 34_109]MDI6700036.1 pantetheine-phosphate adenylyltransferase [bacterium]HAF07708.1 pantetheine-phosphate adenylyltransferase [candidate division WOR-3 bacterium]HCP17116.1 pantetheine-phosphate adenylyltransferase [candidate division WOR-3 bacterium]
MKVIYPGTFDPITNGHLDVLNRGIKLFGEVIILVSFHPWKKTLFNIDERVEIIKEVVKDYKNVKIDSYTGLLVDYIKSNRIDGVIRGLRAVSDFEYEFQMALTNRELNKEFETIFFMTDIKYMYLSSSMVKELAKLNADIKNMVPPYVEKKLKEKFKNVL